MMTSEAVCQHIADAKSAIPAGSALWVRYDQPIGDRLPTVLRFRLYRVSGADIRDVTHFAAAALQAPDERYLQDGGSISTLRRTGLDTRACLVADLAQALYGDPEALSFQIFE